MLYRVGHERRNRQVFRWLWSLPVQMVAVLMMVGVVLYTLLFSGYPPIHDAMHEFRHALMLIPCH
jgi:hypothetical protein